MTFKEVVEVSWRVNERATWQSNFGRA